MYSPITSTGRPPSRIVSQPRFRVQQAGAPASSWMTAIGRYPVANLGPA
jgi:hypothetical protein